VLTAGHWTPSIVIIDRGDRLGPPRTRAAPVVLSAVSMPPAGATKPTSSIPRARRTTAKPAADPPPCGPGSTMGVHVARRVA